MNMIKHSIPMILSVAVVWSGRGVILPPYDPYMHGAISELRIAVVDDEGNAVSGATIKVDFATGPVDGVSRQGQTGTDGMFDAKSKTTGSVWISVEKAGYYKTRIHPDIRRVADAVAVKTRKWALDLVPVRVVLKKARDPKPLLRRGGVYTGIKYPDGAGPKGFDLLKFDWCAPHGKGEYDDLQFETEFWRSPDDWFKYYEKVTVTMTNSVDGMYFADVDSSSAFRYGYEAQTNALYRKKIVFELDRRSGTAKKNIEFPAGKYIVFRTRTKVDESGRIVRANYGLITEKLRVFKELDIGCVFNQVENDPGLEGAWSHELEPSRE